MTSNVFTLQVCSRVCPHVKGDALQWREENPLIDRIRGLVGKPLNPHQQQVSNPYFEAEAVFAPTHNNPILPVEDTSNPQIDSNQQEMQDVCFVRGRPVLLVSTNRLKEVPKPQQKDCSKDGIPQEKPPEKPKYYIVNTTNVNNRDVQQQTNSHSERPEPPKAPLLGIRFPTVDSRIAQQHPPLELLLPCPAISLDLQ